jgi:drug/metabolite transporter (DMT)-like permease
MTRAPSRPLNTVARRIIRRRHDTATSQPKVAGSTLAPPLDAVDTTAEIEPWLQRRRVRVALSLAIVYLVWGSTFIAIDVAMYTIPPMTLMAVRFALAGGLLYAWASRRGDRVGDRPTPRQWAASTLTGGAMLVGGTGLVALAMVGIGAGTAALLTATVPVWLALFARAVYGDRLSVRAWLGLGLGLAGVGVLVDPSGGQVGGMLLAILGAMGWAAGSLRSRAASAPSRPMVAASMEMLGASVIFLLVGIVLGEPAQIDVAAITPVAWASLAYLVTAGSIVAFAAYRWLLTHASTSLAGTHAYVNPIVAVVLAWALLGDRLTARTLVSGAVILVSIILVVTGRPGEPVPAQATSGGDVFAGEGLGSLPDGTSDDE